MNERFDVEFLDDAVESLSSIERKAREKILYNIYKARLSTDNELFKKLIISTHRIIEKTKRTPPEEIQKAIQIKELPFQCKNGSDEK